MPLERATRHSHYDLNYPLGFVPKDRLSVFRGLVAESWKALLTNICEARERVIHGLEVMPDHVHIFLSAPPKWSPSDIAKILKGASARWRLMQPSNLRRCGPLWTNSYFVGPAGSVAASSIERCSAAQALERLE